MTENAANSSIAPASAAQWTLLLGAFARHRLAQAGSILLALIVAGVTIGPWLSGHASATNLDAIFAAPSAQYWLGADQLGRDLLARILEGGRVSIGIAFLATLLATLLGCAYGLLAGMGPVWLDRILMQLLEAILSIPVLLLVIVSQVFGEASVLRVILVIGLASWMGTARMMRTECRRLMQSDFVRAAIVGGASTWALAWRHILPNAAAPLLVVITIGVGQAILIESTLSFLNLGVPANVPSWGNLLGNGMSSVLGGAWWVVAFPGVMIVLTVLAINLLGDGLSDTIDPRRRGQR